MKYTYRNEDCKFDYFKEFKVRCITNQKFTRNKDIKKLTGYIGAKRNVLNIFIVDPSNNHLLFAYGVKEFSEFLYVDTENFKDEIVRSINMEESFLFEFLDYFAEYKTLYRFAHAPFFIKDKNGVMNEINTCFKKSNLSFFMTVSYRVGQKISFDNGNIQCKTIGNGNFSKNTIRISTDWFNIVYNGLLTFRSKLMNDINEKNHWGTKLKKDDREPSINFKIKSLENEYKVNVHFAPKKQIIKITDENDKVVYNGNYIVIDNKRYTISNAKGNLKLPYPGCKAITQFPETISIDKEDIEITFKSFFINNDEKSIVISLDMYEKNPLESFLKQHKEPKKITKYFVIDEKLDEICSVFRNYDKYECERMLDDMKKDDMILLYERFMNTLDQIF